MLVDKVSDYRTQFSKWWVSEYKNVQYPEKVCSLSVHNHNFTATLMNIQFCTFD